MSEPRCGAWIDVKDAKPMSGLAVLVVMNGAGLHGYRTIATYDWHDDGGWLWSAAHSFLGGDLSEVECVCDDEYNVTHWLPIPPLPTLPEVSL